MTDTLQWAVRGESFEDGSKLSDWTKIETSGRWDWQYDTHELTFDIYEHDGQYWKLYRARFVPQGASDYAHDFGGQACRMALVEYKRQAGSPHSDLNALVKHVKAGRSDAKYGAPYGPKQAA